MWRSRSTPEEWERTKRYLIRSLFEDLPVPLSPIYELQEPTFPSSPSNFRSESPLPDLIIEIEPKKPNPHDESDEFYEKLYKQMRRLYKKDFLGIHSSKSSSDIEPQDSRSETYNGYSSSLESDDGLREEDNTVTIPQINQNDITETESSKKSSDTDIITAEIFGAHVEVHPKNYTAEEGYIPFRLSQSLQTIPECDNDVEMETSVSKSFAENTAKTTTTDSSSHNNHLSFASPDIIRTEKPLTSLGTPVQQKQSESASRDKETELNMEMQTREFSGEVTASEKDYEMAERTSSVKSPVFLMSTPRRKGKLEKNTTTPTKREQKRRRLSISPCFSEVSAANAVTQTSFSDREQDCSCFWSNLFVGEPTVYNICSCDNHVCS